MTSIHADVHDCLAAWTQWVVEWAPATAGARHSTCEACRRSPYRAALGSVGLLPHDAVHPLLASLEIIGYEAQEQADSWATTVREEWLARTEPDPHWPDPLASLAAALGRLHPSFLSVWAEAERRRTDVRREMVAAVAQQAADLAGVGRVHEIVEEFVARFVSALDPAAIPTATAVDLSRITLVVEDLLRDWYSRLASTDWMAAGRVPEGERCVICTSPDSPVQGIAAPHAVLHELLASIGAAQEWLVREYLHDRAERPSGELDGRYRAAVAAALREAVINRLPHIRRAIEVYVESEVAADVSEASRWLLVQPDPEAGTSQSG